MPSEPIAYGETRDVLATVGRLRATAPDATFNMFFGAGVSRDPPTNGPIWNEMQVGLLSAAFDRMERANWTIADRFPRDRVTAAEMNIRPEVFWRHMLEYVGEHVVTLALRAADAGTPNQNHRLIAHLLSSGRCAYAITTNFDEHVEPLLSSRVRVEVPTDSWEVHSKETSVLTKLHGSSSNTASLVYTLEQYDVLEPRNTRIIKRLANRPLLIAGYSGYDTDVLPALSEAVKHLPLTVIVKHPGANRSQPVFGLAKASSSVIVVEANCQEVLNVIADGQTGLDERPEPSSTDHATTYRDASEATDLTKCPFLLMAAFGLAGCWNEVHRYAWVTHDACCDAHASSGIDPEDFRRVHLHIAYTLKLCGDASGSRIMLAEAKNSLDATGGRPSEVMNLLWMEATIRDAPNQQRTKDPGISDLPRHRAGFSLSAILGGLSRMHSDFAGPQGQDPHDAFMRAWQLGIVRRRENDAAGAIEAFDSVIHMIAKGIPTHLERCRFLLDFGGALYQWALENESPNFREKANAAYQMCAHIAAQIGDWVTSARSHLMLARIYISAGLVDRSQTSIAAALDAVGKINDAALRKRIEAFRDALEDLKQKRLDQDGIAG